jgi:hypothetical protein
MLFLSEHQGHLGLFFYPEECSYSDWSLCFGNTAPSFLCRQFSLGIHIQLFVWIGYNKL